MSSNIKLLGEFTSTQNLQTSSDLGDESLFLKNRDVHIVTIFKMFFELANVDEREILVVRIIETTSWKTTNEGNLSGWLWFLSPGQSNMPEGPPGWMNYMCCPVRETAAWVRLLSIRSSPMPVKQAAGLSTWKSTRGTPEQSRYTGGQDSLNFPARAGLSYWNN